MEATRLPVRGQKRVTRWEKREEFEFNEFRTQGPNQKEKLFFSGESFRQKSDQFWLSYSPIANFHRFVYRYDAARAGSVYRTCFSLGHHHLIMITKQYFQFSIPLLRTFNLIWRLFLSRAETICLFLLTRTMTVVNSRSWSWNINEKEILPL